MNVVKGEVYQLKENPEQLVKVMDLIPDHVNQRKVVVYREVFLDAFFSDTLDQPLVSFEFYKESKKVFLFVAEFVLEYEEYSVDHLTMMKVKAGTFKRSKK